MSDIRLATYQADDGGWRAEARVGRRTLAVHGRSLEAARQALVEAISQQQGLPAQFVRLRDDIRIEGSAGELVARAREARAASVTAQEVANEATAAAATGLVEAGFSLRDAGYALGVSHARVQQILNERAQQ